MAVSRAIISLPLLMIALPCCITMESFPEKDLLNEIVILEDQRCSVPEIAPYLESPSLLVRYRAALALARLRDESAIPLIAKQLEFETDVTIVEVLLFALGQIGNKEAIPILGNYLNFDRFILRAAAVESAGKLKEPGLTMQIVTRLREDRSPFVRAEACLALFRLGAKRYGLSDNLPVEILSERTDALIHSMKADVHPDVRWRAAYALAGIEDPSPRCAAALREATMDQNMWVRAFAARGLGRMPVSGENQDILVKVCSDPEWQVVVECIKSLARYNNLQTASRLIHLLSFSVSPNVHIRAAAASALGGITNGGESVVKALKRATRDSSLTVEGEAIVALGAIGALADDVQFMDRIAGHPTRYLRLKAVEAALLMKDEGVDYLLQLAEDRSIRVRCAALTALKEFPQYKDEIIPVAEESLQINDLALHNVATDLLQAFDSRSSLPLIKQAYLMSTSLETVETRQKLFDAVIALGGSDDVEFLRRVLADDEYAIRVKAAELLSTVPGEMAIPEPDVTESLDPVLTGVDFFTNKGNPRARVVTEKGDFWIELFPDMAPYHVRNFIRLARAKVYDGLTFHRMVSNFVIQGLDPRGDGEGRYNIYLRDEINRLRFLRGYVGMPLSGPDTGGCQIFITHCPTPHLDGTFTVFGRITRGMNVVDTIEVGDHVITVLIDD